MDEDDIKLFTERDLEHRASVLKASGMAGAREIVAAAALEWAQDVLKRGNGVNGKTNGKAGAWLLGIKTEEET